MSNPQPLSQPATPKRPQRRRVLDRRDFWGLAALVLILAVVAPTGAWVGGAFRRWQGAGWRFGFNADAFLAAPLATQAHVAALAVLFPVGCIMIALPKGDRRHRTLGWIWVIAMVVMGAASVLQPHGASPLAGYLGGGSALALMACGVWFAHRHKARDHGRAMLALMVGLVFISALALLPGRLLHDVFFST